MKNKKADDNLSSEACYSSSVMPWKAMGRGVLIEITIIAVAIKKRTMKLRSKDLSLGGSHTIV